MIASWKLPSPRWPTMEENSPSSFRPFVEASNVLLAIKFHHVLDGPHQSSQPLLSMAPRHPSSTAPSPLAERQANSTMLAFFLTKSGPALSCLLRIERCRRDVLSKLPVPP